MAKMRFRLSYERLSEGEQTVRELIVDAADEGAAYDQAMQEMHEDERLVGVIPAQA